MGRTPRFENEQFIAAAQAIMAAEGASGLTVQKIAARAGATTGSLYHRFESLELIAAEAFIEAAENFQAEFARCLESHSKLYERIVAGARCTPAWSRANLDRAGVLLRMDGAGLKTADLPAPLKKRLQRLEKDLRRVMLGLIKELRGGTSSERAGLLQFLLVDMPLAAVKPHLKKNQKPPAQVDAFIEKSIQGFKGELK